MMTKRIFSLALIVAMLASMFTGINIVSAQDGESTPAGDPEFDKFKVAGVYYDASEDTTNAGTGLGMHLEVSGNPKIYSISTEEGLAAFKADSNYASLGASVETAIANKNAKYASYTDKDQAYNFTEYEGKPALFSINNVATRFVGNWKEALGAPNIYYMIDDDYFAPTDTHATIVVQYFDNTGKFNFKYAKQGGSNTGFTITKGGTNQWVTKVFHVTNAKLSNNLSGTDFINGKHTGRFECSSETYISKFAILKTSDYHKIVAGYDLDFENDTVCQFKRNSELIFMESFNYHDKVGMEISSAGISGLSEGYADRTKGSDAYIVADPAGVENNPVLRVDHSKVVSGTDQITNVVTKNIGATVDEDSEYIVMSHKFWRPANTYIRFFPNFVFKRYSDGGTWTGRALSINHNGTELRQEGGPISTINLNNFAAKWVEYDFVINVHELTVDLYVDHQFAVTFDCTTGSNNIHPSRSEYYVSGISKYEMYFDRISSPGPFYLDDIQIRQIDADQASDIDDYMTSIPGEVNNGTVLPSTTAFTKQAITWSVASEGTGVSIANNVATVPADFDGNVTYKATLADGSEKTYAIGTCGYRTNIFKDTLDNLIYYKDKNIYEYPIPNYKIIYGTNYSSTDATADQLHRDNLVHKVTTVAQNPDGEEGDLVLKRIQTHGARATVNTQRNASTGNLNSDYILYSVNWKIPNAYCRANVYFYYKDASGNLSSESGAGMRLIIRGDTIFSELASSKLGKNEGATFTSGKYANKWVELKVLVDTKNNNARIYYDDEYMYTHTIIRNSSGAVADGVNVCGISYVDFQPDWSAGNIGSLYYDNTSISKMTTEETVIYDLKTLSIPENIYKGTTLPVTVPVTGKTITWTADNGVTIDANGVVTVPSGFKGNVTYTATVNDGTINRTATYTVPTSTGNKYAEYIFGFDQDKSYGMDSYNTYFNQGASKANNYSQIIDGLNVRNTIVDFGKEKTFYYVVKDPAATSNTADSREVTKEEYDAFTGLKQTYKARYFNTSNSTGDSAHNRYEAIGPDGDKRAAVMGVNHMRYDGRLSRKATNSMIHFNASQTFGASDNALVLEVDVYDVGTHNLSLQYRTTAGSTKDVNVKLTNTGVWKTFKYELTDADFSKESGTGLGDSLQDFRFQISTPTYISAVRIYTQEKEQLAESDYTKIDLRDYDVYITKDGTISAKESITAAQAQDAKLYIAIYDKQGDLVSVATSENITNGTAATIKTSTTKSSFDPMEHSIKTFLWDSDLKPYR